MWVCACLCMVVVVVMGWGGGCYEACRHPLSDYLQAFFADLYRPTTTPSIICPAFLLLWLPHVPPHHCWANIIYSCVCSGMHRLKNKAILFSETLGFKIYIFIMFRGQRIRCSQIDLSIVPPIIIIIFSPSDWFSCWGEVLGSRSWRKN